MVTASVNLSMASLQVYRLSYQSKSVPTARLHGTCAKEARSLVAINTWSTEQEPCTTKSMHAVWSKHSISLTCPLYPQLNSALHLSNFCTNKKYHHWHKTTSFPNPCSWWCLHYLKILILATSLRIEGLKVFVCDPAWLKGGKNLTINELHLEGAQAGQRKERGNPMYVS